MKKSVWLLPFPVQVTSKERASVVAINYSIRVQHGHNSDHEMPSELISFFGEKIIKEAVQHVRSLGLTWMNSACYDDRFLLAVVLQIHAQSISKSTKLRARRQEVILIIFKEAFDLFFEGCLKKPLDPALGLLSLSGKFFGFLIFLSESFLDHIWNLVQQPQFFIVVQIGGNIVGDRNQGYWRSGKSIAQNVHPHDRVMPLRSSSVRTTSLAGECTCTV